MIARALVAAGLVAGGLAAGCSTPPLTIRYELAAGDTQGCGAASCSDVSIGCDAVASIRILTPGDPTAPWVSVCEQIQPNRNRDLCSLVKVELPDVELPKEILEVQVVVWPLSAVRDPVTGELDCGKLLVGFDATHGFPREQVPAPALGGHAYFNPGESETVVTLGCTDLAQVAPAACEVPAGVDVTATVDDFDTLVAVDPVIGELLALSVGEPRLGGDGDFAMPPSETERLAQTVTDPVPVWTGTTPLDLRTSACVEVREEGAQTTSSVHCRPIAGTEPALELRGIRLAKPTLDQVLAALRLTGFPAAGLTIGLALDGADSPRAGVTIEPSASAATIVYLAADGRSVAAGATATTQSGLWVSLDAPYATTFRAGTALGLGGRIAGKVSVVLLSADGS